MMLITVICLLLSLGYVLLICAYMAGWARQKEFVVPAAYVPNKFISVIIPARNERSNIGACISAILAQQYPAGLLEIIVVDDHSDDGTAEVVRSFNDARVQCLRLADHLPTDKQLVAYKKAALTAGIAHARGSFIVTTDADCIAPPTWLLHMACIYEQEKADMVVAPVVFTSDKSIVQVFQLIDFMSMQGITAAAHSMKMGNMSNGANLGFRKSVFEQIRGYEGVDNLASGDDYLLMMKISRQPASRIAYLRSAQAVVSTHPQSSWGAFLQQRIRWASKSGKYNDGKLTAILLLVYLYNVSFVALAIAGFFNYSCWWLCGAMLLIKILVEYIYMIPIVSFFRRQWTLLYYPFLQPLHILYITLAGFLGFIGDYSWKGRKVK